MMSCILTHAVQYKSEPVGSKKGSSACGQDARRWMFGDSQFIVINNGIALSNLQV